VRINPIATRRDKEFNAADNVVWLTLEQHIQTHKLLFEINRNDYDRIAYELLGRMIGLEEAHRQLGIVANRGKVQSDSSNRMRSMANMSHEVTTETRRKIGLFRRGFRYSSDSILKMSLAQRGRAKPKIECPHCDRIGGFPQMKQHHFDNCKRITKCE
jgi:hypothetical protein